MKILLATVDYPPSLTSTARLFSDLAEDLARAGHEVTVLAPVPDRYLSESADVVIEGWLHEETQDGIRVLRIRKLPLPKSAPLARVVERFALGFGFRKAGLRLPRQDLVISYSPPLPMVRGVQKLADRWGAPVVVNVQDLYPQTVVDLDLLTNPVLIRMAESLEARVYREADVITVHSKGNRDYLLERKGLNRSEVEVVPNWVDLEATSPGSRENAWRQEHGISSDVFVVSFAGAMGFAQGLDDIVRVADELRERKTLLFLMVGDGTFREELEEEAARRNLENVRFLPPQPPEDYVRLLRASDVSLVPLDARLATPVVPGKLQSIMAAGRAVIQYSHPASDGRRIIEEAVCGVFVRAGDREGLTRAIERLHEHPELAESMGERGRAYAEQHFDRSSSTGRYLELIEDLAS